MGSGFNKTISSYGIIGFVRFLEGYYMILITSRLKAAMLGMAIRVVEFSSGGYKFRKIFAKESTHPKEMIEFLVLD